MEDAIVTVTDGDSTAKPSFAVVSRVADLEGTSPAELTPPLYSAVDPEALDSLLTSATGTSGFEGQVSFTYCGYEVCAGSDGEITITEA